MIDIQYTEHIRAQFFDFLHMCTPIKAPEWSQICHPQMSSFPPLKSLLPSSHPLSQSQCPSSAPASGYPLDLKYFLCIFLLPGPFPQALCLPSVSIPSPECPNPVNFMGRWGDGSHDSGGIRNYVNQLGKLKITFIFYSCVARSANILGCISIILSVQNYPKLCHSIPCIQ